MNLHRLFLAAALTAGVVAPVTTQSPLCFPTAPPWSSNNGGAANVVAVLDLTVNTGVLISQIDVNLTATAGTSVTLEFYTTPGSYLGNELNPSAWTLAATDAGGVTAAGRELATSFPLTAPLSLVPGNYGIGVRVVGTGQAYNTTTSATTVSTNELTLTGGSVIQSLFSGTVWSPRAWNGCIHYTPASGLYPNFTATPLSGASPLQVQFTDTTYTSDPNGVTAWAWDFDNDGNVDSTVQSPIHTYNVGGKYSVAMTATDSQHGSQTELKIDYIDVDPITVDFTASPTFGAAPLLVQFTDTSVGNPIAWNWDFDNDGNVDSTAQNPTHTYTSGGTYTVTLSATNGVNQDSVTKTDLIQVVGATNNTQSPAILEFQFNEPRGTTVANTASTSTAPSHGTLPADGWQADPGRTFWMGNDPGSGCLGIDSSSPYDSIVDTNWPVDLNGSVTFMFWARTPTGTASSSYPFGVTGGGSGRCWYSGTYLSLRSFTPVATTDTATDPKTLTGWNHWAAVIDDQAGTAQWYLNGAADGTQTTFTPGTFSYTPGGRMLVGSYSTLTTSSFTRYFEMDDFRTYGRALSPAQILQAMLFENPTTGTFGSGCAGANGVPQIGASGGAPTVAGNVAFAVEARNMENGAPAAINIGLQQGSNPFLPYDLTVIGPSYAGCFAEVFPDVVGIGVANVGGAGTVALAVPADPSLASFHFYCQLVVLGATQGAVSPALDINFK